MADTNPIITHQAMNQLPEIDPTTIGNNVPKRQDPDNKVAKIASKFYHLDGWRMVGEIPNVKKTLIIGVPHTSNIDGWHAILGILMLGIDIKFMGKKELFRIPILGRVLKWAGIISIDRQKKGSTLQASIDQFKQRDQLWLGLAPEGTRDYTEKWKTGFYHIAMGASVPILPVTMDYKTKEIRFMPLFYPTGDIDADLPKLYAYYAGVEGKHFDKMSQPIQDLHSK